MGGHQLQEKEVEGWLATLNRFLTLQCLLDDIVFVLYSVHGTNTRNFMTQITYLAGICGLMVVAANQHERHKVGRGPYLDRFDAYNT